MTWRSWR